MSDPQNQIEAVSEVNFERVRIMNKSEYRLFEVVETLVAQEGDGHRTLAQVSLGEIIKPKSDNRKKWALANASVNSKRVDIAIIDKYGLVSVVIEYQGGGHHQQKSFIRDAVKREALRRAGISMLEIKKGDTAGMLKESLIPLIKKPKTH